MTRVRESRRLDPARQRRGNRRAYLVLKGEYVLELALDTMPPQMQPGVRVEQLHIDAYALSGALQGTAHEVLRAELVGDLTVRDVPIAIPERRAAGNDQQRMKARERGRNVLDDPIDEIIVFGPGKIVERQHGHGGQRMLAPGRRRRASGIRTRCRSRVRLLQ